MKVALRVYIDPKTGKAIPLPWKGTEEKDNPPLIIPPEDSEKKKSEPEKPS